MLSLMRIRCPRCRRVWYSEEEDAGRVRLCSDCADALKRERWRSPVRVDAFLITAAALLFVDLLLILLGRLAPGTFGGALFAYGMVLSVGALIVFIAFRGVRVLGLWVLVERADWSLMRWPLMVGPLGLACVLAYYSLGIAAWRERHADEQGATGPPPGRGRPPAPAFPAGIPPGAQGAATLPAGGVPPAGGLPGLLGYWSFDDDAQAPRVADRSGKGNHATARGAAWVEGVRGKALAFNGRDSYLDYGTSPDFNFAANAPFTLACWVQTRAASGAVCGQRSSTDDGADLDLTVEGGLPCGTVRADRATDAVRVVGRRPVNDGAWHHLAVTREGGTIELFVNGALAGRATAAGASGPITTDLRAVGVEPRWARQGRGSFGRVRTYLEGSVDEFCVFGRKLSAEEVRTLAGR